LRSWNEEAAQRRRSCGVVEFLDLALSVCMRLIVLGMGWRMFMRVVIPMPIDALDMMPTMDERHLQTFDTTHPFYSII
jgi:hypothetical protein